MIKKRLKLFAIAVVVLSSTTAQAQAQTSKLLGHEAEIDNLIRQMTLEEKIDMLHGKNMFSSAGIPRLGIADVEYADGPFGIREEIDYRLRHVLPNRLGPGCHVEHRLGLCLRTGHEP